VHVLLASIGVNSLSIWESGPHGVLPSATPATSLRPSQWRGYFHDSGPVHGKPLREECQGCVRPMPATTSTTCDLVASTLKPHAATTHPNGRRQAQREKFSAPENLLICIGANGADSNC